MAELGIIEKLRASHGSEPHEHEFRIEIVLEGPLDKKTEYVSGVDHHHLIAEVKKIIKGIENKNLHQYFKKIGYNNSGNETIAMFFVKSLKEKFPVKCVKVWETPTRYAVVYSEEV